MCPSIACLTFFQYLSQKRNSCSGIHHMQLPIKSYCTQPPGGAHSPRSSCRYASLKESNRRNCLTKMSKVVKLIPTAIGPLIQFILSPLYRPPRIPSCFTITRIVPRIVRYLFSVPVTPEIMSTIEIVHSSYSCTIRQRKEEIYSETVSE